MTARRRLLAAAARTSVAAAAVLALTGCERPTPIVTVVSGTTSEWREADVYCFEGQSGDDCSSHEVSTPRIPVTPGQRVGVDVDKAVVERGWYVTLEAPGSQGEPSESEIQVDAHYFSFPAPNVGPEGLRLTVRAIDPEDVRGGGTTGEWTFDLVPR
ncbi:MAG TPA: hypothetical protein VM433_05755 [Mycobacteriales bacterium]|nr:hypothetical protein [Mycobacteriales bacterium]